MVSPMGFKPVGFGGFVPLSHWISEKISTSTAVNYFNARVEREFGQAQKIAATGPNLDVAHGRLWPNGCKWPWQNNPKMEAKRVKLQMWTPD